MAIAIGERDNLSSPPKESKTNTLTVYFLKAQVNDKSLPLSDERGMFWNTMLTTFIFGLDLSVVVLDECLKDIVQSDSNCYFLSIVISSMEHKENVLVFDF